MPTELSQPKSELARWHDLRPISIAAELLSLSSLPKRQPPPQILHPVLKNDEPLGPKPNSSPCFYKPVQETSSTIFPLIRGGPAVAGINTVPPGPLSSSCGTATRLPCLPFTQRTNMGSARWASVSGVSSPAARRAAFLRVVLGACFLRSLLIVSCCKRGGNCQNKVGKSKRSETCRTLTSSLRLSLRLRRRRAISRRRIDSSSAVKCFLAWTSVLQCQNDLSSVKVWRKRAYRRIASCTRAKRRRAWPVAGPSAWTGRGCRLG